MELVVVGNTCCEVAAMAVICAIVVESAALGGEGSNEGCVSYACVLEHLPEEGAPAALGLRLVEISHENRIGNLLQESQ